MRPNNDEISIIFDWLYLGGVKNTRKTLPLIDIWYDFKWNQSEPKNLTIPTSVTKIWLPFDDGDLEKAVSVWKDCFNDILFHKSRGKKIFISCYEGVSRSAMLALWLCCEELGQFDKAWSHLKTCRNIHPDKSFIPFMDELRKAYP